LLILLAADACVDLRCGQHAERLIVVVSGDHFPWNRRRRNDRRKTIAKGSERRGTALLVRDVVVAQGSDHLVRLLTRQGVEE